MSSRYGNREQMGIFPQCIEGYVKADDPVRACGVIVGSLDFSNHGIELDSDKVGCPHFDPKPITDTYFVQA
jgi:hypothetical protein